MKKSLLVGLIALFILGGASKASAQKSAEGSDYTNSLGLGIDFGETLHGIGATLVGGSGKHFFTRHNVGAAEILFGNQEVYLQAFYQYHREFDEVEGLRWYAGVGPNISLYNGFSEFAIVPIGGIEYKIPSIPFSLSFDWRPKITLTNSTNRYANGGTNRFMPARFGLGFRYTFN